MDSSLLSGEKKIAWANLAVDAHRAQGHLQKRRQRCQVTIAHDLDDRSSVVTDESFNIAACKLRIKPAQRITLYCHRLSLEVLLKPTVSLRRAQNRPYLDRNAYSGQYAKIAVHKARDFDFSGFEPIQTNVCIGR
jgi:hypothetical protein